MIVVGGITRLTQSGLSMVEWEPIMGIIPPIGEQAWQSVFAKYKTSPEYLKVNAGMSLDAFKGIFYWEYGHRVLGRVIGLIYLLPLLYFLARGMVPKSWYVRLFGLFILGGLQGLMGWYMVKSGLVDVPHVSQYRLTAHLGLAIVIFGFMLWYAMDFLRGERRAYHATSAYLSLTALVVVVVFIMMLSGGFVAGLWRNFFENPVAIQFVHRCMALLVVAAVLLSFVVSFGQRFKTLNGSVVLIMLIQVCLGISALVLQVPVALGAAHQAGAVALLTASLYVAHRARKSADY